MHHAIELPPIQSLSDSDRAREARGLLIARRFIYYRVGADSRPMGFLENGVIGDGAADREVFWRIVDQGESLQLEIYSANKKLTCRLTEDNPGVWRGQWTRFERMLIEISCPIQRTHKTAPRIISFAIMTVVRPKIYIHELLRAFRSNERIRLIVGGVNSGYLKRYRDDVRIEIIPPSAEAYALVEHYSLQHRASWNYLRCLTLGPASTEGQGLLVVEDDVILAKGWKSQLHKVLNQIEAAYRGQYLLALYAAFPHVPISHDARTLYVSHPVALFFGTQAIYFPEPVRAGFADYLKTHGVESFRTPYDVLLKEYLKYAGVHLFVTIPCLAQHIGRISTGLATCDHKTQYFEPTLSCDAD
jgi:hypothetical protein